MTAPKYRIECRGVVKHTLERHTVVASRQQHVAIINIDRLYSETQKPEESRVPKPL